MNMPDKFAPKAKFADRCAFYYAVIHGNVPTKIISKLWGADISCVKKLISKKGSRYKDVREEYDKLGQIGFYEQYYTKSMQDKIGEAMFKEDRDE